jgi:hypothetical protein
MLYAATAGAQSGADLLQKGIYAQETLGDLDGAIRIYRQVTGSATAPKQLAAQAQYQLVLCMLQKGDRAAAAHELDLLTRDFPDQQDFINKARKLIPGASTLLAPPWGDGEASQLNIKRDGVFTGEYLYYSATPWRMTVPDNERDPNRNRTALDNAQAVYLAWQLKTTTSTRAVEIMVDRDTMRRMGPDQFDSDDALGDPSAAPFAGPAIDAEPLVFRMRMLPLAVGYKTTLTTLPFLLGQGVPRPVDLAVTAVEAVQTVAGKFNCYKVSFASLGQTFWIGVDGARPLVKFQSGKVEAELVKVWASSVFDDALAFLKAAGWTIRDVRTSSLQNGHLEEGTASAGSPQGGPYGSTSVNIRMRRIYTPPAEVEQAVQKSCSSRVTELRPRDVTQKAESRPDSVRTRMFGGHPSASCIIDTNQGTEFNIWVRTESLNLRFSLTYGSLPVFRWIFEPILDTIKLP